MTEMITRAVEIRATDEAERTITGLAVPYGQDAPIGGGLVERFAPGAIQSIEDVKLFWRHDEIIGKIIDGRETPDGFEVTAQISDTSLGRDAYALVSDGSINRFSVGFYPVEQTREDNTITRTLVDLAEVSLVPRPAYSGAVITQVREEQPEAPAEVEPIEPTNNESEQTLSDNIDIDVRALADDVAEMRREIQATAIETPAVAPAKFRSIGEYAKGLAAGDSDAEQMLRTYAAATSADTYMMPGWVGFINNLIDQNRPSWNVWSKAALPATGLSVDYAKVTTNGISVDTQSSENAAIAQGNLVIDNVTASVATYAGGTELSRQLVERSSVPYLDTAFQAMAVAYANKTNAAVIAAIAALDFTGKVMDMDGGTAKSILEGITDGAKYIKVNSGLNAEFILCSTDVYKYLVTIADSQGRPVVTVNGDGSNTIGNAPAPLTASIWGLPVVVDTTLSTGLAYLANSNALRLYENASPTQIVDEVSGSQTLTNKYAVYGYGAITVPFEAAIVKLDVTA